MEIVPEGVVVSSQLFQQSSEGRCVQSAEVSAYTGHGIRLQGQRFDAPLHLLQKFRVHLHWNWDLVVQQTITDHSSEFKTLGMQPPGRD